MGPCFHKYSPIMIKKLFIHVQNYHIDILEEQVAVVNHL